MHAHIIRFINYNKLFLRPTKKWGWGKSMTGSVRYKSIPQDFSCDLSLLLSVEHSGFMFQRDPSTVLSELKLHSGGKVQQAVSMALTVAEKERISNSH
jgi:hypothetical protein